MKEKPPQLQTPNSVLLQVYHQWLLQRSYVWFCCLASSHKHFATSAVFHHLVFNGMPKLGKPCSIHSPNSRYVLLPLTLARM